MGTHRAVKGFRAPRTNGLVREHFNDRGRPKVPYKKRHRAEEVARDIQRVTPGRYHAYLCPICEYWHVGKRRPEC